MRQPRRGSPGLALPLAALVAGPAPSRSAARLASADRSPAAASGIRSALTRSSLPAGGDERRGLGAAVDDGLLRAGSPR